MTKEKVIELDLNAEEIDGPPVSYFEISEYRPDSKTLHSFVTPLRFSYLTYAIGIKHYDINKEYINKKEKLIKEAKLNISNMYKATYHQKPEGFRTNYDFYDLNKPLLVWRKRATIRNSEYGAELWCRFLIVPPQQVNMVKEYLKSLESSND